MPYYVHAKDETPKTVSVDLANGYWTETCPTNCCGHRCFVCRRDLEREQVWKLADEKHVCKACYEKRTETETAKSDSFPTRFEAFEYLKTKYDTKTHTVTFVATDEELANWRRRERQRFRDGTYLEVPWTNEITSEDLADHYAHISTDKAGMIAYTPDVEAGVMDKQIRLTPGRYLERFYSEQFTKTQIAEYVATVACYSNGYSVAKTIADVRKVYRNGPASCMGGPKSHTDQYWREDDLGGHMPAEVYTEPGDLAVAYFGPIERPSQRCVIWPAKKRYVRIYGTGPLEKLLRADGFTDRPRYSGGDYGSLVGAKVPNIRVRGGHLMPYVDGADAATVDGKFLTFCEDGDGEDFHCHETSGVVGATDRDEDEDEDVYRCDLCNETEDDCTCWSCEHCDERQTENADRHDLRCNRRGETLTYVQTVCESCHDRHTVECQDESCDNRWHEATEFRDAEIEERRKHDLADLCRDCAAHYIYCDTCEKSYDTREYRETIKQFHDPDFHNVAYHAAANGEKTGETIYACPECNRYPRCEKTGDLLTAVAESADSPRYRLEVYCPPRWSVWSLCYFSNAIEAIGSFEDCDVQRQSLLANAQRNGSAAQYRIVPEIVREIVPPEDLETETETETETATGVQYNAAI